MAAVPRLINHFEPEKGWMNDPNGLCFFNGSYHAFFQHNPHDAKWGPMHWGHAVSKDLVNWREMPIALYPDMPYENAGGCFSGSAVVKDGRLWLFYTAVSDEYGQAQAVAVSSDGEHFEKYAENPVLRSPVDPAGKDFRDPKVFPYGDEWRMVCGAGKDGVGKVLLFKSKDLIHWEYVKPVFESKDFGPVPECPDMFETGGKWILMFSRMDESRSAQFVIGAFDGESFTAESYAQPEKGTDFYAPQSFLSPDGRRIVIGWLFNWNRKVPEGAVRAGALSLARELSLEDGSLKMKPVREAGPRLYDTDPYVITENGLVRITNGEKTLFETDAGRVHSLKIYPDTRTREVFINGGETAVTFYIEK